MSILNTSVSGMQANSNWLSSISQNVANANTTGYKNVQTEFETLVDQIANGSQDFGGVSTSQVALNALQGNVVSTSTSTDLAIQGAGYFVVSDGSGALYLTRTARSRPTPRATSSTARATTSWRRTCKTAFPRSRQIR